MGLAAKQRALITRAQLLDIGLSPSQVKHRVRTGRLRAMHRGVYLLGPVLPPAGRELAALLACGPNAYLSHASAAARYRLPLPAEPDSIHVTATGAARRRPGVTVHRTGSLHPDEVGSFDAIPIISPARTILDLAGELSTGDLERLLAEAYATNLASRDSVLAVLARHPGRPGSPALGRLLDLGPPAFTRSKAERRFLALIRRAELPRPRVNADLHGYQVDFHWPEQRLVIEVDGHAFHGSRPRRERDSRRDQELIVRGYTVMRVTWHQITDGPEALVARLAAALSRPVSGWEAGA